jgi:hypothetical protein
MIFPLQIAMLDILMTPEGTFHASPPNRAPSRFREVVGADIDPAASLTRFIAHATKEFALVELYPGIPWDTLKNGQLVEIRNNLSPLGNMPRN